MYIIIFSSTSCFKDTLIDINNMYMYTFNHYSKMFLRCKHLTYTDDQSKVTLKGRRKNYESVHHTYLIFSLSNYNII